MRRSTLHALAWASVLLAVAANALAAVLPGDLNGDGSVDLLDEPLMLGGYEHQVGDPAFDPAADLTGDGRIDVADLAVFGANHGSSGGDVDVTAPGLFVTLNDVPDDMNDLLVVPPDGFQITLDFDSQGHSMVDTASLSVTAGEDIGAFSAGTELASQFTTTPLGAVWEIPSGSDLDRTAFFLDVAIRDMAGNEATDNYGFAVRDFEFGPPLGNLQRVHLDFDQHRMLGPQPDFVLSMREYGLSSVIAPTIEIQMRNFLVSDIVGRVHMHYGRNADGSPGPDPANIVFTSVVPIEPHSTLCVGGEASPPNMLGGAALDQNNTNEFSDECVILNRGVFPHAIDNLWGGDPNYLQDFSPVKPSLGGTPIGEHADDATVTSPGFQVGLATPGELERFLQILIALDSFSRIVAAATAHEVGHMLGLVAHGDAPGGLYGGDSGNQTDHNVTVGGSTPAENFLMNAGASFSYDEMTARNGMPTPAFRPLNWAYVRDRVALNAEVTGLFPGPQLHSVSPNPASFGGMFNLMLTFSGENFVPIPVIELLQEGNPVPSPVTAINYIDDQTVTGVIWTFFVSPGTYDVRFLNGDDQEVILEDGLTVQ